MTFDYFLSDNNHVIDNGDLILFFYSRFRRLGYESKEQRIFIEFLSYFMNSYFRNIITRWDFELLIYDNNDYSSSNLLYYSRTLIASLVQS